MAPRARAPLSLPLRACGRRRGGTHASPPTQASPPPSVIFEVNGDLEVDGIADADLQTTVLVPDPPSNGFIGGVSGRLVIKSNQNLETLDPALQLLGSVGTSCPSGPQSNPPTACEGLIIDSNPALRSFGALDALDEVSALTLANTGDFVDAQPYADDIFPALLVVGASFVLTAAADVPAGAELQELQVRVSAAPT